MLARETLRQRMQTRTSFWGEVNGYITQIQRLRSDIVGALENDDTAGAELLRTRLAVHMVGTTEALNAEISADSMVPCVARMNSIKMYPVSRVLET